MKKLLRNTPTHDGPASDDCPIELLTFSEEFGRLVGRFLADEAKAAANDESSAKLHVPKGTREQKRCSNE